MEQDPQPADQPPATGHASDPAVAGRREGDLGELAAAARDATFGSSKDGRVIVPGVISGDLGAKGRVSAQLRSLSRRERATHGQVPRGVNSGNGVQLLLLPMLAIGFGLLVLVALLGWLLA